MNHDAAPFACMASFGTARFPESVAHTLEHSLRVPDLWQQQAIRALQQGRDVVVDGPTGSGKTYIFELLVEGGGLRGNAVYTVPTRALANDKLNEWRRKRWNVGIATGDLSENLEAPVVVATLETQKHKLLRGEGPGLLVVDEYQMLADHSRGVNYELAISAAPRTTQLLLLSGSVGNPAAVVAWLRRLGRDAVLVQHRERPVPLEEVQAEALPDRIPDSVQGTWPRVIARALKAGMAPLLTFAPRRKAAEGLAIQLARMLPEEDPLILTPEQQRLAGPLLTRLLRARIAYHHSGLDYAQRAGLIEPLAKAGQLRVVVCTMGLSSGINFSMRSVLVTDREYRHGDRTFNVRPDELLQMFGRAGRRGIDKRGYALYIPGKPRWAEARPLTLRRPAQVDWPSMLAVMHNAVDQGRDPVGAAQRVASRLFSEERVRLGLRDFIEHGPNLRAPAADPVGVRVVRQQVVEFQNPDGAWERKRAPQRRPLGEVLWQRDGEWLPALAVPACLDAVELGRPCRIRRTGVYGRELPIARYGRNQEEGELVLTKPVLQRLRALYESRGQRHHTRVEGWTLDRVERQLVPLLPDLTQGGVLESLESRGDQLYAKLDYSRALTHALVDSLGRALLFAPERIQTLEADLGPRSDQQEQRGRQENLSPAEAWHRLGLIDAQARPTRRGRLFSYFNHGEGLALAAALEDVSYPIEELVRDLANLRAGHRFMAHEEFSGRLGNCSRACYRGASHPGYLRDGVPTEYGDGAAELIESGARGDRLGDDLGHGDLERARLEWRSLLQQVVKAPAFDWDRWLALKQAAHSLLDTLPPSDLLAEFPPLTAAQSKRHKSFLRFEDT